MAVLDNLDIPYNLTPQIEVLEDPYHNYTREDVLSGKYDQRFEISNEAEFVGRPFSSRFWFRLNILPALSLREGIAVIYTESQAGTLFYIDLAVYHGEKEVGQDIVSRDHIEKSAFIETGHTVPVSKRQFPSNLYAMRIPITPGQPIKIIGMIDNSDAALPIKLPLKIIWDDYYQEIDNRLTLGIAAFYAVMLALFVYNIALFIALREKVYGYYLLFLLSASYLCASTDGSSARWIFPDYPEVNIRVAFIGGLVAILSYTGFIYHTLSKAVFLPAYQKVYRWLLYIGTASIPISLVGSSIVSTVIVQVYSSAVMIANLVLICYAIKIRESIATYLLIAESCVLIGASIFLLSINGVFPNNIYTLSALHMGFMAEALLLSLAMAASTRQIQDDYVDKLKRYENLYEDSHEGLFEFDLAQQKLTCNTAYAALFGFQSKEEMLATLEDGDISEYLDPGLLDLLREGNGQITGYEYEVYSRANQKHIWVSLTLRLELDADGGPAFIKGSMVDINTRKLRKAAEREAIDNLRRTDKLKDKFLTSISYDLRPPMGRMMSDIVALQTMEHEAEIEVDLKGIGRSASNMTILIDRLLEFTRTQSGDLFLESDNFTISDILDPIIELSDSRCQSKGLVFSAFIDDNVPVKLRGDKTKIGHILNDLLDNAIKFTEKGSVSLVVKSKELKTEQAEPQRTTLYFSIQDTGQGIDKKDRENIFGAFTQADGSFSRGHGGLGLGLSMCRRFVDLVNGELTVVSELNKGSRFDFVVDVEFL